ncbi:MAG TPA: NAD-dependent succinate-semialdehyde dehydrogenase [Nitrosopumilaceae archaeon]|nr:NAD-dependent succinate-semialdehyde dehydrogenase [Nitrosopumilaceae archaeon]
MKIQTINPATEQIIGEYESLSEEQVNVEVNHSRMVYEKIWKKFDLSERAKLLRSLSSMLVQRKMEYATVITNEMGKPISESIKEVEKCAWVCTYYADNGKKFLERERIQTDAKDSYVQFDPLGVIGCIMPWNFPFWQVLRFCIPALLAGNTVVLKHSSVCIEAGNVIQQALEDIGFPKGVFRHITGNYLTGEALAKADVDAVSITGSTKAGIRVAEIASKNLHKFILELGGSDPFVVLKDANIEEAAKVGVASRFLNNGQSCIAAKRFIVEQSIVKEFTKKYIENVQAQIIGDPLDPKTTIGPLVRDDSRNVIINQIGRSSLKGAQVLMGGDVPKRTGFYFNPTVLSEVRPDMPISREEVFGPVAPILSAKDHIEAIRFANDTEFGLGASIWSESFAKENNLAKDIEAGMVFVNSMVISDPRMPFGGIKNSGIGRELSNYGLKEFVNIKSVIIN